MTNRDQQQNEYREMMRISEWTAEDLLEYRNILDGQVALKRIDVRLCGLKVVLLAALDLSDLLGRSLGLTQEMDGAANHGLLKRINEDARAR